MGKLTSISSNQGRWKEIEELNVQLVETSKRVLGIEHPDTLTNMGNLASICRNQGRWKEADELNVQVLETMKRVLGVKHQNTLRSIANLASTYRMSYSLTPALIDRLFGCFRLLRVQIAAM
jgi:uncharacterized protein Veg